MGAARNPRPFTLSGRIGERVESLRKARGLSSRELAAGAGLGQNTIFRLERGEGSPTADTLAAVAKALGTTIYRLVRFK